MPDFGSGSSYEQSHFFFTQSKSPRILLWPLFCRWGCWGTERLSNLCRVTQQVSSRAWIWSQQLDPRCYILNCHGTKPNYKLSLLGAQRTPRLLSVGIQSVFKEKLMFSSARKGWGTYVGQICEEASPANDSRRKVSQGHLFTLRDASHFIGPWLLFILVDLSSGLHG